MFRGGFSGDRGGYERGRGGRGRGRGAGSSFSPSKMTDVSILVMVVASLVFQVSDATIGSRKDAEEDFTWKCCCTSVIIDGFSFLFGGGVVALVTRLSNTYFPYHI